MRKYRNMEKELNKIVENIKSEVEEVKKECEIIIKQNENK